MKAGATDDSGCPFGVMVPVLLLISLKVPGILGPIEKLLTLPPSMKFAFGTMTLPLKGRPMARAIDVRPFLVLTTEKRAARLEFGCVSTLGSRLSGAVCLRPTLVCRFVVQVGLISRLIGTCIRLGLLRQTVWLWQVWCTVLISMRAWVVGATVLRLNGVRTRRTEVSVMLLEDGGGVAMTLVLWHRNWTGLCLMIMQFVRLLVA